jgi:O-succinylbenzoate synthase
MANKMSSTNHLHLERLDLTEIEMPLRWPFETSFGRTTRRRILLTRVYDRDGAVGYGECTVGEDPFYNHETTDSAWLIIAKYVGPLLAAANVESAAGVGDALARIRGNRMARGAVEAAVWDLEARVNSVPLWQHLGGTRTEIDCGVSIGLQETPEKLLEKVDKEITSGYQRIKVKIKPGRDIELVEAIRAKYPSILLSVDANSAYSLEDADLFKRMDAFNLLMIEQPLAPGDLVDHAKLQREIGTPICLDESILTVEDARHALELGSCRIINIKLGRVGGHSEARRIHDCAGQHGIPVWCGGMLEAGIGRAHNIAMSTLAGFTLPGDVSASERYWQQDIIEPPVTVSREGKITPRSDPGIGYRVDENRISELKVRREEIRLG